jgi:serralysin
MLTELDVGYGASIAEAEYDENTSAPPEASSLYGKQWNPNRTELAVDFLTAPPYVDTVITIARLWQEHTGVTFRFGSGAPDILVDFKSGGSWSFIGTDSKSRSSQGKASMNFGWFDNTTTNDEFHRVVLHEFGHALSLIHEHQAPTSPIPWNPAALLAYYQSINPAYDNDWININVVNRYQSSQVIGTEYDPKSIMHYPIPPELLLDPTYAVPWSNVELSSGDKAVAGVLFS